MHPAAPRAAKVVGLYASIATAVLTLGTFVVAFLTPPRSGPFCREGCFEYPFVGIESRFPRDYYWMYPALAQLVAFLVLMVAVHACAPREKRIFSHLGALFAFFSFATLEVDYVVQVSVIQPSLLLGERDGIALLSQFNAHGVYIVLEEIGFTAMSVALLCLAPVVDGRTRVEKAVRWLVVAGFVAAVGSFALISHTYGLQREYRFEVAIISIAGLTLNPVAVLLAVLFGRSGRPAPPTCAAPPPERERRPRRPERPQGPRRGGPRRVERL